MKRYDLKVLKSSLACMTKLNQSGNELAKSCINNKVIEKTRAEYEKQAKETFDVDDFPRIDQIYLDGN